MKRLLCIGVALLMSISLLFGCNEEKGNFYSLQECYDNGYLTTEDLKNIAFYYNDENYDDSFEPTPKIPETLSNATENNIKQVYLNNLKERFPDATLGGIRITKYYGTYDDCVVVTVWDDFIDYDLMVIPEQFIGSILFKNYCEREIYVYIIT